jgi:hypothetical protein
VATNTASYALDISPPVIDHITQGGSDSQGGQSLVGFRIVGGSPNQAFTATALLASTTLSASSTDTFGGLGAAPSQNEPNQHELLSIDIPCDAPLGTYNVQITVAGNNSCGGPYSVSASADPVTIKPGLQLTATQVVIADFGVAGYTQAECFSAVQSGAKINTAPGSFHTATLLTSEGKCVGFDTLSNVQITQTIPSGFAPFTKRPLVGTHVFETTGTGFDLHNPPGELTLAASNVNYSENTVTITLPGPFNAADTIYVRTHIAQALSSLPSNGTGYLFTSVGSASTQAGNLNDTESASLVKDSINCVDGTLP